MLFSLSVEEMIAEVDIDGDGRIDYDGISLTKNKKSYHMMSRLGVK